MDLVRDLLDVELHDRHDTPIGRVDGIVLELRNGRPPRVAAMEVGAVTLARRLHPRLARWLRAALARVSPVPFEPVRIPLHTIRDIGVDVRLAVDGRTDASLRRGEKWLRTHVIARLPGGTT